MITKLAGRLIATAVIAAAVMNPTARGELAGIGTTLIHGAASAVAPGGTLDRLAHGKDATVVSAPATPAHTGNASSHYTFLVANPSGSPARWSSCAPIHYTVNLTQAPAGVLPTVQHAMAELHRTTGLSFVYDGTSSAALSDHYLDAAQRDGRGATAPLLIGWGTPQSSDILAHRNDDSGMTDAAWIDTSRGRAYVAAVVALDSSQRYWKNGFGPGYHWGSVLLHELGHVAGLGHASDPGQIMYPTVGSATSDYGQGDRTGLAREGKGGCL